MWGTRHLKELQELRTDFNNFARDTGERVSCLEIQVKHGIPATGSAVALPGPLQSRQDRVESLSAWRWRMVGICTGVSLVITVLGWLLKPWR